MTDPLLSAKDAAPLIGLSPRSAHRLMASGAIHSCRIGPAERLLRTTAANIEEYKRAQFAKANRIAA